VLSPAANSAKIVDGPIYLGQSFPDTKSTLTYASTSRNIYMNAMHIVFLYPKPNLEKTRATSREQLNACIFLDSSTTVNCFTHNSQNMHPKIVD
jgi:hypothetical protein